MLTRLVVSDEFMELETNGPQLSVDNLRIKKRIVCYIESKIPKPYFMFLSAVAT